MSNRVFPLSLPGIDIALKRHPVTATAIQTAVSGAELRASWQSYPRYRYSAQVNVARSAVAFSEFQRLMSAFVGSLGPYDTFLIQDPEDYQVTSHGFAIADGSSTLFQLQRTLGGSRQSGFWDANAYPISSTPRTNVLLYSQDATNAAWAKVAGGVGTAPTVTGAYALAPDGTLTAARVQLSKGSGGASSNYAAVSSTATTVVGERYTYSQWLKSNDGADHWVFIGTLADPQLVLVTPTWTRFSVSFAATASTAAVGFGLIGSQGPYADTTSLTADSTLRIALTATDDTADLLAWGAQFERGSMTEYIATTSAPVTVNPAYWPAYGDGFEPVAEVNPATLAVYDNGTPVTFTLQSGGGVLLDSAPANGHVLTWSGQYFRRVRFEKDEYEFTRVVSGVWAGSDALTFISVK